MKPSILALALSSTVAADLIGYNRLGNNIITANRKKSSARRRYSNQIEEERYKKAIANFLREKNDHWWAIYLNFYCGYAPNNSSNSSLNWKRHLSNKISLNIYFLSLLKALWNLLFRAQLGNHLNSIISQHFIILKKASHEFLRSKREKDGRE